MTDVTPAAPAERDVQAAEFARVVCVRHFGGEARRITRQGGGLSNAVFLVDHAAGQFVVRLSDAPGRLAAYRKEQWAVALAQASGVPTPEIIAVGDDLVPCAHMIARRVAGHEASHHPRRLEVLRELGHWAAAINTTATQGWGGAFDEARGRVARHDDWSDYLRDELRLEPRLETLERQRMTTPACIARLRGVIEAAATLNPGPTLNHGDLRLKNVLVDDDGAITAIIDWETSGSFLAPAWELSIALHDLAIEAKHAFLAGYGIAPEALEALAPLMKAFNIINYAPEIERLYAVGDLDALARIRMRLSGALDLYSLVV
ncbi:MAG TPA: aminoglycoside phosphotransferase family protein [Planctomycetota bacterium]|nr:aminoglycoside phosphotransferase family protein [Planctomycetota bacterium]